jgi:hypothetical protein
MDVISESHPDREELVGQTLIDETLPFTQVP